MTTFKVTYVLLEYVALFYIFATYRYAVEFKAFEIALVGYLPIVPAKQVSLFLLYQLLAV